MKGPLQMVWIKTRLRVSAVVIATVAAFVATGVLMGSNGMFSSNMIISYLFIWGVGGTAAFAFCYSPMVWWKRALLCLPMLAVLCGLWVVLVLTTRLAP